LAGAQFNCSVGNLWNAGFMTASGTLRADFRFNFTAESQGRLQVARLYNMTNDNGVRDMLSYLIARDTMHQSQWLAAIAELQADGLEMTPVPSNFPQEREKSEVAYQFLNHSEGIESSQGQWAQGPASDGKGTFTYVENLLPSRRAAPLMAAEIQALTRVPQGRAILGGSGALGTSMRSLGGRQRRNLPDDFPVPDVALRLRCSTCGSRNVKTVPAWREGQWAREYGSGR
jgi:Mn-containing catalase